MYVGNIPREPEDVIVSRNGSVLGKKTVLKSDHFPGCQNKKLLPHVDGAPNFRQVSNLPVFGVAIPTIEGIREVLHLVGCLKYNQRRKVLWHNMREEPVVYINGRPFVLREVERPFTNLEYTGIDRARVEQMEMRLKQDVLEEASKYANKIMVSDELPDGQMVDQWEPIGPDSVQTPLEVYQSLQSEGYNVAYERVPVTDEKSPKERDFDLLVQNLSQVDESVAQVFNCQMGRGRTTTGMVVATLVHLQRTSIFYSSKFETEEHPELSDTEESLRRGEYKVIRSLTRVLEGGLGCKKHVDVVIDKCSAMQNLREAILQYRNNILRQADEKKRQAALTNFVEYLERYYFLICFSVYLATDPTALQPRGKASDLGFRKWMKDRPELYSILRRLLRRDPMGALSYKSPLPETTRRASIEKAKSLNKADMEQVLAARTGEVLGKQTCLKSDHCPGCQSTSLTELVEGAPNFREISGFPVFGVANPTLEGIRAVLHRVGGGPGGKKVVWHNMREEPTVFINGKPFVLREVERPFKNILEYSGIDKDRVEKMEARLKDDVQREAESYGGELMVNHETEEGHILDVWKRLSSVQTPLEAYQSLQYEGFNVEYERVPITDGKAPQTFDFDALARKIADAKKDSVFVFNCQMGRGRTTTGTVIATLVLLRCINGRPMKPLPAGELPEENLSESDSGSPREDNSNSAQEPLSNEFNDQATEASHLGGLSMAMTESARFSVKMDHFFNSELNASRNKASFEAPASSFTLEDIPIVRKFTRLVDRGSEVRDVLDSVIDRCASMQNIRRAILHYRRAFNNQDLDARVRQSALSRGVEYLERYCMLIAFAAYLESDAFCPGKDWNEEGSQGSKTSPTFREWIKSRPEINQLKWSMRLRPARVFTIPEVDLRALGGDNDNGDAVHEAVVRSRTGSVLGRCSILKLSLFPGLKVDSAGAPILNFPGAHNVCAIEGFPVYSMATPTVDGAKNVFAFLGASPENTESSKRVIVTDLREEAVVYIKGKPYVLREIDQPVSTLKHVGIEGLMVEKMEQRMKEDVLYEASRMGGRVLLHKEWQKEMGDDSTQADVRGFWEAISSEDVLTPSEVYKNLASQGFDVDYRRIPLTRERFPKPADVDAIQRRMDRAPENASYLFISHTGFGGIAYAIAITCLRLHAQIKSNFVIKISTSSSPSHSRSSSMSIFSNLTPGFKSPVSMSRVSPLPNPPREFDFLSPPSPRTSVKGVYSPTQRGGNAESIRVALFGKKGVEVSEDDALKRGEYRDVLSLVRVLVHGPQSKFEVDSVIDRLVAVGSIRDDILEHKKTMEACGNGDDEMERKSAENEAGLRALRRYCYLVVFRAYLFARIAEKGSTEVGGSGFREWINERPELVHIVEHLKLQ